MKDSLGSKIQAALDGQAQGNGVMDFASSSSAIRKGDDVLQTIQETGLDLASAAILSIGGADGAELEHILRNTQASHGLLFEFDDNLSDHARERARALADSGKTMRVFTGDVIQKLEPALDLLKRWIDSGSVRSLVVTMHAVLHELPDRGSGKKDLEDLLGKFLWHKVPVLAIAREPCMPAGLPNMVYLKADCQPDMLAALANRVRSTHPLFFESEAAPVAFYDHVRMGARLAVETIWKLFYLDSFVYELGEKITSFTRDELLTAFRNVFGTRQVRSSLFQTDSFDRLWSDLGLQLQDEQRRDLAKPEIHIRIVAKWTPPSLASPDGNSGADHTADRRQDSDEPEVIRGSSIVRGFDRRSALSVPVDLWTPGPTRELVLATYEPLLGFAAAESLWQASQAAISAVACGDFNEQIAIARRVALLAPDCSYLVGEAAYLEAEGFRLLADMNPAEPLRRELQEKALERYRVSTEFLIGDPRPVRGIGRTLEVQGDYDQALQHFRRAEGLALTGLSELNSTTRFDLAHEVLRVSRHLIHCLLEMRSTSQSSVWNSEHKRRELEGYLVECENLHREHMPSFAMAPEWSRIEWFMGLVFIAKAWGQLGASEKAKHALIYALDSRRRLLLDEGQLSGVERSNLKWWYSVAIERSVVFDRSSRKLLENIAEAVDQGDRAVIKRLIQDFLVPLLPPWDSLGNSIKT